MARNPNSKRHKWIFDSGRDYNSFSSWSKCIKCNMKRLNDGAMGKRYYDSNNNYSDRAPTCITNEEFEKLHPKVKDGKWN